ncbi:hypothetical protein POM88_001400 [Heracleum sosnowskyi]|uniref:Protein kinase domain-containing protein n=1 Tax=Heracleum sosnowskyi TaxID=360622 RepID=A0AAD8JC22_9APIA|nr:hypothetical protein POM88_001400 [Heracleum sosnowskyi]
MAAEAKAQRMEHEKQKTKEEAIQMMVRLKKKMDDAVKARLSDLSLKGSPHWMAPEVLLSMMRKDSKPELAFAVDIWSVGCTVIEMLNGKPPWSEYSGVQNCNIQLRNSLVKALLPGLDRLKDTRAGRNLANKILDLASPRRR